MRILRLIFFQQTGPLTVFDEITELHDDLVVGNGEAKYRLEDWFALWRNIVLYVCYGGGNNVESSLFPARATNFPGLESLHVSGKDIFMDVDVQ